MALAIAFTLPQLENYIFHHQKNKKKMEKEKEKTKLILYFSHHITLSKLGGDCLKGVGMPLPKTTESTVRCAYHFSEPKVPLRC